MLIPGADRTDSKEGGKLTDLLMFPEIKKLQFQVFAVL